MLILPFAAVAEAVLDRCMLTNKKKFTIKEPTNVYFKFNYTFLDDHCGVSLETWWKRWMGGIRSCFGWKATDLNTMEENQWRPEFSPKDHPLALMVSWYK